MGQIPGMHDPNKYNITFSKFLDLITAKEVEVDFDDKNQIDKAFDKFLERGNDKFGDDGRKKD